MDALKRKQTYYRRMRNINSFAIGLAVMSSVAIGGKENVGKSSAKPTQVLPTVTPQSQGMNPSHLIKLSQWIKDDSRTHFSVLVSRHGKLVYELYTSQLTRDHSHYLMSVTKSVASALVGIAVDRGLIHSPDDSLAELLPQKLFRNTEDRERFRKLTLKHVMGMSALNALIPPHGNSPEDQERAREMFVSDSEVEFALLQKLVDSPGVTFQYNDITPALVSGVLAAKTGENLFEFAKKNLFDPLGFKNSEWMNQDQSGLDRSGFGLRLRPYDMLKFGNLYLNGGLWQGKRLLSEAWVKKSFDAYMRIRPDAVMNNYGWFWWAGTTGSKPWKVYSASGWKGQRIAVVPELDLVVVLTAYLNDGSEEEVFQKIMGDFVIPSTQSESSAAELAADTAKLKEILTSIQAQPMKLPEGAEARMVPSIQAKEKRVDFRFLSKRADAAYARYLEAQKEIRKFAAELPIDTVLRHGERHKLNLVRIYDLLRLKAALANYYRDHKSYPANSSYDGYRSSWGKSISQWIPGLTPKYIHALPRDPRLNEEPEQQYLYRSNGADYVLIAHRPDDCEGLSKTLPQFKDPIRTDVKSGYCWGVRVSTSGASRW